MKLYWCPVVGLVSALLVYRRALRAHTEALRRQHAEPSLEHCAQMWAAFDATWPAADRFVIQIVFNMFVAVVVCIWLS